MDVKASYEEGHLFVAAVRVLEHRHAGRPPTVEEIAELLSVSVEWAGVLVSSLERAGVVHALTGPFETRVEVKDYLELENLPRADSTTGVDEELKEFAAEKRKEEEKLGNLFSSGDPLKKQKEKMGKMADQLKGWKPKGPKSSPLFEDPPSEND